MTLYDGVWPPKSMTERDFEVTSVTFDNLPEDPVRFRVVRVPGGDVVVLREVMVDVFDWQEQDRIVTDDLTIALQKHRELVEDYKADGDSTQATLL